MNKMNIEQKASRQNQRELFDEIDCYINCQFRGLFNAAITLGVTPKLGKVEDKALEIILSNEETVLLGSDGFNLTSRFEFKDRESLIVSLADFAMIQALMSEESQKIYDEQGSFDEQEFLAACIPLVKNQRLAETLEFFAEYGTSGWDIWRANVLAECSNDKFYKEHYSNAKDTLILQAVHEDWEEYSELSKRKRSEWLENTGCSISLAGNPVEDTIFEYECNDDLIFDLIICNNIISYFDLEA